MRPAFVRLGFAASLGALACAVPEAPEARTTGPSASHSATTRPAAPAPPASVAPATPPPEPPASAPPPPPSEPGRADLDPNNDTTVAPPEVIADCDARLAGANVSVGPATLPRRSSASGRECGAPQVVVYSGAPGSARIRPKPLVTCGMALALARFETILQEEAARELGSPVVSISQGGTYNCRDMARFDMVSEHSYANAIDLRSFALKDGRTISVERHFGRPGVEPTRPEGRFLRALARRLYDEGVFSVVLTEYFDRLHRDHFHLDLARYRIDGTR